MIRIAKIVQCIKSLNYIASLSHTKHIGNHLPGIIYVPSCSCPISQCETLLFFVSKNHKTKNHLYSSTCNPNAPPRPLLVPHPCPAVNNMAEKRITFKCVQTSSEYHRNPVSNLELTIRKVYHVFRNTSLLCTLDHCK